MKKRKKKINLDDKIIHELPSLKLYPGVCPIRKAFVEEIDAKIKFHLANLDNLDYNNINSNNNGDINERSNN